MFQETKNNLDVHRHVLCICASKKHCGITGRLVVGLNLDVFAFVEQHSPLAVGQIKGGLCCQILVIFPKLLIQQWIPLSAVTGLVWTCENLIFLIFCILCHFPCSPLDWWMWLVIFFSNFCHNRVSRFSQCSGFPGIIGNLIFFSSTSQQILCIYLQHMHEHSWLVGLEKKDQSETFSQISSSI